MQSHLFEKYQRTRSVSETAPREPTEREVQALWFEQLHRRPLFTDDGREVRVIQPGHWNHAAGPDFLQAALEFPGGEIHVGCVEIHLRAGDWEAHGHHLDAAYENTIAHLVWQPGVRPYFPATKNFRRVPQIFLREQLVTSWAELSMGFSTPQPRGTALARPGICQRELARLPKDRVVEILRAAGAFRLRQKAQRLGWRSAALGRAQVLWEALAEALGYHRNKIPMRLLAQRLPAARPALADAEERKALLFGLAGFLPAGDVSIYPVETQAELRPLWDRWWKARAALDYALVPRELWKAGNLRPANRPERRLAALTALWPFLHKLEKTLHEMNAEAFAEILGRVRDEFWERHSSWSGRGMARPLPLIGSERVDDIILNIFWPWAATQDEGRAEAAWLGLKSGTNSSARIAQQRVLGGMELGRAGRESLVQQGLLQIYQDYCLRDASDCQLCPFPDVVKSWPA